MKVLITGVAGFIGSHVADRFVTDGWDVTGVDDLSSGYEQFVPSYVKFINSDFSDAHLLKDVNNGVYDYIVHLAARPRVSYSVLYPDVTHEENVTKTMKLVNASRGNIVRFVFASSSSVYGGAKCLPTPTYTKKNPQSPYALQKSIVEDYLELYSRLYTFDCVSLRFFNVFGPRQLGSSSYATAVSSWLDAIYRGGICRSDGDGLQTRDMCYVDNVVEAVLLATKHSGSLKGQAFNVGCGDRISNIDILNELKRRFKNVSVVSVDTRPGDVKHTQADIMDTKDVLGYEPLVSFWDGLDRTIEWFEASWEDIKNI